MQRTGASFSMGGVVLLIVLFGFGKAWATGAPLKAGAAASIRWQIDRATVALGEPVMLTLTQPLQAADSLESMDFTALLGRDFDIQSRTSGRDARQEDLRLELYPLHYGRVSLNLPGKPRGAAYVDVTHGSDTAPDVDMRIFAEPANWVMRQPARLVIEACYTGTLVWQTPPLASQTGLAIMFLGEEQISQERHGAQCTAQRWYWSVTPTVVGLQTISPGMLQARRYGTSLRYLPPSLKVEVQAVPSWLPQGIAVGAPSVVTKAQDASPRVGEPWEWRWEIEGAYSAETLRAIFRAALKDSPEWSRFPADIRPLARSGARPAWEVRLYAVPARHGGFALPAIRLPWYDAGSQALQYFSAPGGMVIVADPARERFILTAQVAAMLLIAIGAGAMLWRRGRWRWRRHLLMRAVRNSKDPSDLQRNLLAFSRSGPAAGTGRTMTDWREAFQSEWVAQDVDEWLLLFHRTRFGAPNSHAAASFEDIRHSLITALKQARPRKPSAA